MGRTVVSELMIISDKVRGAYTLWDRFKHDKKGSDKGRDGHGQTERYCKGPSGCNDHRRVVPFDTDRIMEFR